VRSSDLIAFGLSALRRQKLRTALTLLGVVIGTATLVISVSIGLGVRHTIDEEFKKDDRLRQISVFPSSEGFEDSMEGVPSEVLDITGTMSDAKRERIRKLAAMRWKRRNTQPLPKPLTSDRIEALRNIPHVVDVIPDLDEMGRAFFDEKSSDSRIYGVPHDYKRFQHRLEVGGGFSGPLANECIVHEYLLYRLGIRDDAAVKSCIGKPIRVELTTARRTSLYLLSLFEADLSNISEEELRVLEKAWKLMPEALESLPLSDREKEILLRAVRRKGPGAKKQEVKVIKESFTIVGVIRAPIKGDPPDEGFLDGPLRDSDLIIPRYAAEEFFTQLPRRQENGPRHVRLIVDHEDNLEAVDAEVKRMRFNEFSLGVFIHQLRKNVMLVGLAMDFIALVAIIVAALGITNTMFTTVLERTREIGIMKAVGAKDRQIMTMFLIEGGLIGLLGGAIGVLVGWLASFPGNGYALKIMEEQGHKPLPETVFLYPPWLLIGVPLFAMLITTLAAVLPARRAARVEPVVALRHE
jgi:putative ABC transport system permease protein